MAAPQFAEPRVQSSDSASWAALVALSLMVVLCEWTQPVAIDMTSTFALVFATLVLSGTAYFYRKVRPRENFAVMCIALMQVLLFSGIGIVLSYLVARFDRPLMDEAFIAADRALGFDWMAYMAFVDGHPVFATATHAAYGSLIPQIILLVLALGFTNRLKALRTVMLAAILTGTLSVIISAIVPALAYPAMTGVVEGTFVNVNPSGGLVHLHDVRALRDGTYDLLDLRTMQGIITFPSYHAGLSLVTMWGFCKVGQRWLAAGGVLAAALTIAATPTNGGHYLVDVLAGLALAAACLKYAGRAIYWRVSPFGLTASPFRRSRAASGQ